MKLSNKALTFLLAQYRAILKRSLMVSLGSVLAVAPSISTVANAAVVDNVNSIQNGGTLEINANNLLQINAGFLPQITGTLHITGGEASKNGSFILNDNYVINTGLGGGGEVIIDTKNEKDGLYLSQTETKNGNDIDISTYNTEIRSGTLHLKPIRGAAILASEHIVISGSNGVAGTVILEGSNKVQAIIGRRTVYSPSVIHLKSGGVIELRGSGERSSAYIRHQLSGEGGTIKVTQKGMLAAHGKSENLNIEVAGDLGISLEDNLFNLEINSGTISLEKANSVINYTRGNLILGDDVRLLQKGGNASANTGIQFVVDNKHKSSFLHLSSKTLKSYLEGTDTGNKGLVKISDNSNIVLTDENQVDLNQLGIKFSNNGQAGTIMLQNMPAVHMIVGGNITGKKIKVDRKFNDTANFQIVADELDLTQATPLADGDYGFRSFGANSSIVLDELTKRDLYLGLYLDPSEHGTINTTADDITLHGRGLTAYRGVWEQNFNLNLGESTGNAYTTIFVGGPHHNKQTSRLNRSGTYILGEGKTIKLNNGKLITAWWGTMDLTKGSLDFTDAGDKSAITVFDESVLRINAADFNNALNSGKTGLIVSKRSEMQVKNVDPQNGMSLDLSKLEVRDKSYQLVYSDESISGKIIFDKLDWSKLSFDGPLNLQGSTVDLSTSILAAPVVKASDSVPLNIKSGVVEVSQGLEAAKGVILGSGGSGVLRLIEETEGVLNSNIETAANSAAGTMVEVKGGDWLSKGDVTLKGNGELKIGVHDNFDTKFTMEGKLATEGANAAISVNHAKAQLNANEVSLAKDSSLKITDGSVVFNGVDPSGNAAGNGASGKSALANSSSGNNALGKNGSAHNALGNTTLGNSSLGNGVSSAVNNALNGGGSIDGSVAGINISGAHIDLKGKGSLIFGQNVVLAGLSVADDKVWVADGLKAVFTGDESSTIKFDGAIAGVGEAGLSLDHIGSIMDNLGLGANSEFHGFVNFGDNGFDIDVEVDENGNNFITADNFAIFGRIVNEKATNAVLEKTRITELKAGSRSDQVVQGSLGALQGEDGIAEGKIHITGTTKLNQAVDITLADGSKIKAFVYANDGKDGVEGLNPDGSLNGNGGAGNVDGTGGAGSVGGSGSHKGEFAHLLGISNGHTGKDLTLANGGYVADVSMRNGSLHIDKGATVVEGNLKFAESGDLVIHQDTNLLVNGKTSLGTGTVVSHEGSSLEVRDELRLNSDATLLGKVNVGGNLSMSGGSKLKVVGGAVETQDLVVKSKDGFIGMDIRIGQDSNAARNADGAVEDDPSTLQDESKSYGGSLFAQNMQLNKSLVVVDPDYGEQAAFFGANNLNGDNHLNATLIVAQNSIAAVGFSSREEALNTVAKLQDEQGSLTKDKYGAVLVLNKGVVLEGDSSKGYDSLAISAGTVGEFANRYNTGTLGFVVENNNERTALSNKVYLGANTAIVVSDEAAKAAMRKAQGVPNGAATGAKVKAVANGAQANAVANAALGSGNNASNANGSKANAGANGAQGNGVNGAGAGNGSVTPARSEALISFKNAAGTIIADGGHVVMASDIAVGDQIQVFDNAMIKYLSGALYNPKTGDPNYNIKLTNLSGFLSGVVDASGSAVIALAPNARAIAGEASDPLFDTYVAYVNRSDKSKSNSALVKIIDSVGAADGDRILRAPAFAGVAHASFAASLPIEQALKARFDVGTSTLDLRSSDGEALFSSGSVNVKGGSLFVAPIYSSFETDPLGAQGLDYAVDLDLYGTVVGLDYELMPNLRVGGLVSLGKGEVKGSHAASKLSNDFKYYGVGAFASVKLDDFTLVGDVSYTQLSHDVKTGVSALSQDSLSLDSSHVVIGSSLQYRGYSYKDVDVMPYLGVHYHNIAIDNYSVDGMGSANNENINYLAVPVGVTVAKNFTVGEWKLKHSVDLNVTSSLGLDDINSSFKWENFEEHETRVSSKFLDKYSAGATLGLEAQVGKFECNVGFNYQVSKDSKSVGLNAGMRYLF